MGIFSCSPIHGFWNKEIKSSCVNSINLFLATAAVHLVTDVALVIFPMPILWNLKVSKSHRVALFVVFLIAGL
jgi:hypothetical protein